MTRVVFRNGSLFDGHRHLGPGVVVVEGGRIAAVGTDDDLETVSGPGVEEVDLGGGLLAPGFVDAHVHPIQGGLERLRCDLSEHETREAVPRSRRGSTPPPTRTSRGSSAAAGRCRPSPAARRGPPTSTPSCRTGRCSCPTGTTTERGSTAGPWSSPGSTRGRRTRRTAGSSATPTGRRAEPSTRAATSLVSRHLPADDGRGLLRRADGRPGLPPLARRHRLAGRDRRAPTPAWTTRPRRTPRAAGNGDLRSHVVGALWWERRLGVEQVADLVGRREAMTAGRFRATTVKIMQDGVAENFTAAMIDALPRPLRPSDRQPRAIPSSTQERFARQCAALDAAGFQVHVHAIGDRASREALDAFEGTDPAHAPPHRPPAAGAPRRRAAVRGARRRGQHPGAVGLPATTRWST